MSNPEITAISVFVEVDGLLCVAPVRPELSALFVGMLSAYQSGDEKETRLFPVPDDVRQHVFDAGSALQEHLNNLKLKKAKA